MASACSLLRAHSLVPRGAGVPGALPQSHLPPPPHRVGTRPGTARQNPSTGFYQALTFPKPFSFIPSELSSAPSHWNCCTLDTQQAPTPCCSPIYWKCHVKSGPNCLSQPTPYHPAPAPSAPATGAYVCSPTSGSFSLEGSSSNHPLPPPHPYTHTAGSCSSFRPWSGDHLLRALPDHPV